MITGMHALIYTKHPARVRAFLTDVLQWRHVDAGNGRLMFAAPPTEVAAHETNDEPGHELYLMCDDVHATVAAIAARGFATTPVVDRGWGLVTAVEFGDGERIGLYEPHHLSALS